MRNSHIAVHSAAATSIALAGIINPIAWLALIVWLPAVALDAWFYRLQVAR